ncbi:MAG: VCBS domain-containing protein [Gammaproteobacteria bacterium]|nr:VCBS domain-containing protein [Gammaproteobacteria bacterium]
MLNSYSLKPSLLSTLATLVMTLQLTACGTDEFLSEISPNIGTDTTNISDTDTSSNSQAIISGTDTGSVIEDVDPDSDNLLEVSGTLNIIDNDTNENGFISTTVFGNFGSLNIDINGNWSYAAANDQNSIQNLDNNQTLIDTLTISSIDGTTHNIIITIVGVTDSGSNSNTPAIISGIDSGSVTEDVDPDNDGLLEIGGALTISDIDAGESLFIATTYNGNYGNLTIDATGNWNYSANNSQASIQNLDDGMSLIDGITVNSVDGTSHIVSITLFGVNESNTTANLTLSWTAPSEREDNSAIALSEIAGYKIFYGATQGDYTNSVNINDNTATDYTFSNFSAGTYYFVITTIDTDGRESQYSSGVNITI